ncbi:hypothetical protein [Escherichia phage RDN8.1]|nr:hypothetical protein [Escherichia phage RDN8.1]
MSLSLYLYQPQVITYSHHLQSDNLQSHSLQSSTGNGTTYSHRPTVW